MKPRNWDQLPMEDKIDQGNKLYHSLRGRYLIGQALAVAIQAMGKVPMPHREVSNIQDMEILRETVFTLPVPQDFNQSINDLIRRQVAAVK